ncbi:MAG TPA: zinc-dependent metalloprotease [Frankiaceae bacterium]|nr:zinc-dependent metalloprotease [Frankiaceae bacterium]
MPALEIDWATAVATAKALVRPGPDITPEEAHDVVAELRSMVPDAERHVAAFTRLTIPDVHVPVAVVDRIGWVKANVDGFRVVLEPLVERLSAKRTGGEPPALLKAVGSRVTGVQVGTIMSYLASRVLGQFELFIPPGEGENGRLTLVAPNIVETERRLGVDPHDFRLWVTLHEVTHRTQFTAVPWLRGYFLDNVSAYVDATDLDPSALMGRLRDAAAAVRGAVTGDDNASLLEALQTPQQREIVGRLQALMSLLEGHGDFVMDGVGPAVVPTAELIRERFNERRKGSGPVDRVIRRLFGLDMKMRQYAEGERFVNAVVEAAGMDGFNRVWEGPENLPTQAEIADPALWVARVATPASVEAAPKKRAPRRKKADDPGEDASA